MDSLLAARLGMPVNAPQAQKPVAAPVMAAGNHAPAPQAAEGHSTPAAPKKKHKGDPKSHLDAALKAHGMGDHATAKKHALRAVNMLHQMTSAGASPSAAPGASGAAGAAAC